jgi:hypothetical protein
VDCSEHEMLSVSGVTVTSSRDSLVDFAKVSDFVVVPGTTRAVQPPDRLSIISNRGVSKKRNTDQEGTTRHEEGHMTILIRSV